MRHLIPLTMLLAGCLTKEEKLALFDDDLDGFYTKFGEDWGGEPPWDCDDDVAEVNPGAVEVCNGIDDNCDEAVDDGADRVTIYADLDGDGFGDDASTDLGCDAAGGESLAGGDCNDDDDDVYPDATEVPYDSIDQDCDDEDVTDVDGDGFDGGSLGEDCDDDDEAVNPSAVEVPYDGVDADCSGNDDNDADADGHKDDGHGGDDCDDDDPLIHPGTSEGWTDLTVDNDCDGSIIDQAVLDVPSEHRIGGPAASAKFGTMLVLPGGWAGTDPELIVAAVGFNGYEGRVYGWQTSELVTATKADDASSVIAGPPRVTGPFGSNFGGAMAWLGDATTPISAISASAGNGGRGEVYGWHGSSVLLGINTRTFRVTGAANELMGTDLVTDTDLDGDGVGELIIGATVDGRLATNAGSAAIFLNADALTGELTEADADATYTIAIAGVHMFPTRVGDVDLDGRDDLALALSNPVANSGTYLVANPALTGSIDAPTAADARFTGWWPGVAVGHLDTDGLPELIVAGDGLASYDLPVTGVHDPFTDAAGNADVTGVDGLFDWVDIAPLGWRGPSVIAGAARHASSSGLVTSTRWAFGTDASLDDATLWAEGESAGDAFGAYRAYADVDGDFIPELILGAASSDAAGTDSGAIYVLPGPR